MSDRRILHAGAVFVIGAMLAWYAPPLAMLQGTSHGRVVDRSVLGASVAHAASTRANTVAFFIGTFASNGSTNAKSLNATNTLPDAGGNFTFKLMESSVSVKNAFVDWTVHFNAESTSTTLTSLFQNFDTCTDPCTPSAWTGTGVASTTYTTTYLSNSGEADVADFKLDVTNEAQLAAYTGGGALMRGQFGYCLGTATTCTGATAVTNNISYVTGVLYITYTYTDTSPSLTNTVTYPLESNTAGDAGTRRSSQAAGCTIGSNCPTFTFNTIVPEFASGNQLSSWFGLNGTGDSAGTTDYATTARIGTNAQTASQIFDETKSANDFGFKFQVAAPAGYAENTTSTFERTGTGNTMFTLGGEVYETYAASSSAATKTRTIRIPFGELCATQVTTQCSVTKAVSFNETGVSIKKAWSRVNFSVSSTTATTLAIATTVAGNATTTDTYNIGNIGLGISHMDTIYDVIPSSTYATLGGATRASPVNLTLSTQYAAARGSTSGEVLITYTYTGEAGGYETSETLFGGSSENTKLKSTWSATSAVVKPAIPETSNVTVLDAGLRGAFFGNDSDGLVPANHGGVVNTTPAIGANLSTGTCTPTNTSIPMTATEDNTVLLFKDVTSIVTSSTSQTYTPCYSDRDDTSDTTAGFQVSGEFILLYQVFLNSPPSVSAVTLNHGQPLTLTPNATTSFDVNYTVTDANGCADVFTSGHTTSTAFRGGVSATCAVGNPTTNNQSCYLRVTSVNSCSGANTSASATDTVQLFYFAQSTGNASSSFPSDHWFAYAAAADQAGATSSATSSAVDVPVLTAINVTTSSVSYGTVTAGTNTGSTNQTTTVTNAGNSSTTLQVSGTALTAGANVIATSSEHYATSSFSFGGAEQQLSGTPTTVSGFLLTAPTSTTNISGNLFWGLTIPTGLPVGGYTGTLTFSSLFSP